MVIWSMAVELGTLKTSNSWKVLVCVRPWSLPRNVCEAQVRVKVLDGKKVGGRSSWWKEPCCCLV
jgi:hypothetical protein